MSAFRFLLSALAGYVLEPGEEAFGLADDLALALRGKERLLQVLPVLRRFGAFSSLELHPSKTVWLAPWPTMRMVRAPGTEASARCNAAAWRATHGARCAASPAIGRPSWSG